MDVNQLISDLNEKYKDNEYMLQRIQHHIISLPNLLDNEKKRHDERVARFNELLMAQDNFHQIFLSKHQYYYMPHNNTYYKYDGKTYNVCKDDDIHYMLLSTITDEGKLLQWKHKTKQIIIKKIKERSLFQSTPETFTIQNVLSLLQPMFNQKKDIKYFLTVIGDCILKKENDNLLYFVSPTLKKFVTLIDSIAYFVTGNCILNSFITKYHDSHKLNSYRLLRANDNQGQLLPNINDIGIDLLCVAAHYSERYGCSDAYLRDTFEEDDDLVTHAWFFRNRSIEHIIDHFLQQCITPTTTDTCISWKSMHYIWKLYLTMLNVPNMLYAFQLQEILVSKLQTHGASDGGAIVFTNVTSKYLPDVSLFLNFWTNHITVVSGTADEYEYEVDELLSLFKSVDRKHGQFTEQDIVKMVCHYFSPAVEVIDNKYVTNIKCNLWSKHVDAFEFLLQYQQGMKSSDVISDDAVIDDVVSFDELYQCYIAFFHAKSKAEKQQHLIMSKQFFEKILTTVLEPYLVYDRFVSLDEEWCLKT